MEMKELKKLDGKTVNPEKGYALATQLGYKPECVSKEAFWLDVDKVGRISLMFYAGSSFYNGSLYDASVHGSTITLEQLQKLL